MRKLRWPTLKIGGREGFIPASGELVSKRLFELPEYPYLRKYLARKSQFHGSVGTFLARQSMSGYLFNLFRSRHLLHEASCVQLTAQSGACRSRHQRVAHESLALIQAVGSVP